MAIRKEKQAIKEMLPSEPPNDNEEPKYDNQEEHIAHPSPALSFGHCVHSSKCPSKYPRGLGKCVILFVNRVWKFQSVLEFFRRRREQKGGKDDRPFV